MARKPRIHFAGAVYHVTLTGLDQQTIFKTVADRRAWESLIAEGAQRFGHTLLVVGYNTELDQFVQIRLDLMLHGGDCYFRPHHQFGIDGLAPRDRDHQMSEQYLYHYIFPYSLSYLGKEFRSANM